MYTPIDAVINDFFNQLWGGNGWGNLILISLSILFAAFLSGIIGFEREYHGHAAGLRTHLLVAIGSAIVMVISIYGFPTEYANGEAVIRDPARLAAQVISGIGFLGAGTIIQTGTDVKGLTTATTLWLVMAIGLAAGSGSFVVATIGTLIAFIALVSLRRLEKFATRRNPVVTLVVPAESAVLKDILAIASKYGVNIRDTESQLIEKNTAHFLRITMRCSYSTQSTITAFVDNIRSEISPLEMKVSTDG